MVKVAQEFYPQTQGFYLDGILAQQIEILAKNVVKDWDYVIIVSGGGETRVGKSLLAMQIAAYWKYLVWVYHKINVPFNLDDNFVFNWEDLIEKGNKLGEKYKYSPLIYDEAGESLEGVKALSSETKAVKDFLRECGQHNLFVVLVIPEFFDLPKSIVVNRTKFLLDVYYNANDKQMFERGFFKFYSQKAKKRLYLRGKRELNYGAYRFDFQGRFTNTYTVDEELYRLKKQEALKSREKKLNKWAQITSAMILDLKEEQGTSFTQLALHLKKKYRIAVSRQHLARITEQFTRERG